jgi:predicted transcriptional regulator
MLICYQQNVIYFTSQSYPNKKHYVSGMTTNNTSLNIDDIIAALPGFDNNERAKLHVALFDLQNDLDLQQAIQEGLDDVKNGRVLAHEEVMKEIKAKYNLKETGAEI